MSRTSRTQCLLLLASSLVAIATGALAQSSNTATTRSFTSEWQCANGRSLLFNAHPRRPREEAHIRYVGSRVEVRLQGPVKEGRYVSQDGKVAWQLNGNEATFSFEGMLPQPTTCARIVKPAVKK